MKREGLGELPALAAALGSVQLRAQVGALLVSVVSEDLKADLTGNTRKARVFSESQPLTCKLSTGSDITWDAEFCFALLPW